MTQLLLYHYTCDYGRKGITEDQALRGNPHPFLPDAGPIIWLTDLDAPDVAALGLTGQTISCDRTRYRFVVETDRALHWPRAARVLCTPAVRRAFDWAPGAMPMHWWVVIGPELLPLATSPPVL